MRCPVCAETGSMGLLQKIRRGKVIYARYFCRNCCSEICFQNQQVTSVFSINEDGEAMRTATGFGNPPVTKVTKAC